MHIFGVVIRLYNIGGNVPPGRSWRQSFPFRKPVQFRLSFLGKGVPKHGARCSR